jgi:hypothetical protein
MAPVNGESYNALSWEKFDDHAQDELSSGGVMSMELI